MSLRVWLPLDGDLRNLGLDDITPVLMGTGITYTDGKIGKAATFPNSCSSCIHFPGYKYINNFSWACWFKCVGQGSGAYQFILSEGRDCGSCGLNLRLNKAGTTMVISFMSTSNSGYTATVCNINLNIWYHVAITISKDLQLKAYLNGEQIYTIKIGALDYAQSNDRFVIGKMAYYYTSTSSYFPFNGQVNDVRIYDHCLSPKEVKEISKGLVAHYPLNDGIGNENLVAGSYDLIKGSGSHATATFRDSGAGTTYNQDMPSDAPFSKGVYMTYTGSRVGFAQDSTPIVAGPLTQSVWVKAPAGCTVRIQPYWWSGASGYYIDFTTTGEWQKLIGTTTTNTKSQNMSIGYVYFTGKNSGDVCYVCGLKVEYGSVATPWIPNPADALYSELGLDDNIVYDCSGYGRNGTAVNSPTADSNTVRYSISTKLNGTNCIYLTNFNLQNEWTISVWTHDDNVSSGWGGICTLNNAGSDADLQFGIYTNPKETRFQSSANGKFASGVTYTPGQWNHIVNTYDGTTCKIYLNGEYKTSFAGGSYLSRSNLTIGGRSTNTAGAGVSRATLYNGKISDVRIYATALSDEDIKELYETSASIDSHGNMWAYEIQEV